jgi:hypothetical protein
MRAGGSLLLRWRDLDVYMRHEIMSTLHSFEVSCVCDVREVHFLAYTSQHLRFGKTVHYRRIRKDLFLIHKLSEL